MRETRMIREIIKNMRKVQKVYSEWKYTSQKQNKPKKWVRNKPRLKT